MNHRRDFLKLAAAATAALASGCASTSNPESRGDTKTYVLVHGAWHGGWCWSRVADRLRAANHRVFTPTQTGLGDRAHLLRVDSTLELFIQDIVNVIEAEELNDVILVGHSFGGRSVVGAADRIPNRLHHLVFLDAGMPQSGKSVLDGLSPDVREARIKAAQEYDGGLSIPPPNPADFSVTDAADAAWLVRRMTKHPFATYTTPITLHNPVGNGVPATYIRCTEPLYAAVAPSAEYAKSRKDWQYLEIKTGHDAMVTAPAELARMLLAIG